MDFNVNFKGKSESFSGIKAGVKKENMNNKFHNVFDYIDTDKNGIMSDNEIQTFLQKLQESAKGWNSEKLSKREARKFLKENGLYTEQFNESTLFEMLNLLSNESEKIKSTKMTDNAFVIVYKNDEEETIYNETQNNNVKREIKNCKDGVEEIKYFNESNEQLGSKKTNEKEGIEEFYDGENKLNKKIIQKNGNEEIYTLKEDKSNLFLSKKSTADSTIVYQEDGRYVETKNDGTKIEGNSDGSTKTTSADEKTITEESKEKTVVTQILNDNSKKVITTMNDGTKTSVAEVFVKGKKISQTVNNFTVNYDSDSNTKGVIVQNGESPALVAKRFNCDLEKLLKVNKSKVKGSGNNRYFLVGEEIVIPREIGAKEFQSLQANRGGKADEIGKYEAYIEEQDRIEADKFNKLNQQAQQEVAELNAKDAKKNALSRLDAQQKALDKTKKEQGIIGKGWDWFKNVTGIGDGSEKAQKQIDEEKKLISDIYDGKNVAPQRFKALTGKDYNDANIKKFKNGSLSQAKSKVDAYKEGQDMAVDMTADVVSGVVSFGIYVSSAAAAPFTGGGSFAVGIAAATTSGAAIKTGLKALDATTGGRKYSWKDAGKDAAEGAVSGALAPVTAGVGGAVGKTVAKACGAQVVKSGTKSVVKTSTAKVAQNVAIESTGEVAKNSGKAAAAEAFNSLGHEYSGNVVARVSAYTAEFATDGALMGASDGAFRTALEGGTSEDILNAAIEGAEYGAKGSFVIGSGMRIAGRLGSKVKNGVKDVPKKSEGVELEKIVDDGQSNTPPTVGRRLNKQKSEQVKNEVEDKMKDPKTTPEDVTHLESNNNALRQRKLRRENQKNIDARKEDMSSKERSAYQKEHEKLQQNVVDHVFDKHNALNPTDRRNLTNYINDIDAIDDLSSLKTKLKDKQKTNGGTDEDYNILYSQIDARIDYLTPKIVQENNDILSILNSSSKGLTDNEFKELKAYITTISSKEEIENVKKALQNRKNSSSKRAILKDLDAKSKELSDISLLHNKNTKVKSEEPEVVEVVAVEDFDIKPVESEAVEVEPQIQKSTKKTHSWFERIKRNNKARKLKNARMDKNGQNANEYSGIMDFFQDLFSE